MKVHRYSVRWCGFESFGLHPPGTQRNSNSVAIEVDLYFTAPDVLNDESDK